MPIFGGTDLSAYSTTAQISAAYSAKPAASAGSYTGNNSQNRAIPHGLGVVPSSVKILATGAGGEINFAQGTSIHQIQCLTTPTITLTEFSVTAMDATNFYVGDANPNYRANVTGRNYYWEAIR